MATATEELEKSIRSNLDKVIKYADTAVGKAQTLTDTLKATFSGIDTNYRLGWASVNIPQINTDLDVEKPGTLDVSKATSLLANVPRPSAYAPGELPSITPLPYNAFTAALPELSLPQRPSRTQEARPAAETVNIPDLPAAPDAQLPAVPSFAALTLEEGPPLVAIEPFTDAAPEFAVQAPAGVLSYNEQTYESELQEAARAWLKRQVEDGGTGLAPAVEQAIWDRGMTREVEAARRNLESAEDEYAAAGYPMPPGALRARQRQLRKELQDRAEDLSRKVSEEQAKLAQENTHFAITKALELEALKMQHFNNVADRALSFAKAAKDVAITVFNARVAEHNARLEGYKSRAQVHEINVRAALQELENRRVYLEGKRLEGSLRQQEVDLYRAQVQGVESLFSLYRSQLEGVKAEGDIERLKIEKFRGEMEGYIAGIRADEAEFAAYQAELSGERSKIDAYAASAQGYRAETEAKKSYVEAQAANLSAQTERERARIEQHRAEMETYRADLDRNRTAIEAVISEYRANNETYRAAIAKAEAEGMLKVADVQAQISASVADREMMNAHFRKEADVFLALQNLGLSGVQAAAGVQSSLASSALSSITNISELSAGFTTVEG